MESDEQARVSSQREALGDEGLQRKGKELKAAIEFNQVREQSAQLLPIELLFSSPAVICSNVLCIPVHP